MWWWVLIRLVVMIVSRYIHRANHGVYPKLINMVIVLKWVQRKTTNNVITHKWMGINCFVVRRIRGLRRLMSKVGFNLKFKEWIWDEGIEKKKKGVAHKQPWRGGQGVLCSGYLKNPKGQREMPLRKLQRALIGPGKPWAEEISSKEPSKILFLNKRS